MANYKPKSLDELNEFFDKVKSAEQAFQKGKSLLKEENIYIETDFPLIDTAPSQVKKPEIQLPSFDEDGDSELFKDIDEMFKSIFSEEKPVQKQAQSITYSDDAPIKGKELSGLMDDYVKVMTDSDYYDDEDDDDKRDPLLRRRKAKRKSRQPEDIPDDIAVEIEQTQGDALTSEKVSFEEPKTDNGFSLDDDFKIPDPSIDFDFLYDETDKTKEEEKIASPTEAAPSQGEVKAEEASKGSSIKNIGSSVTSVLLTLVLLVTVIVGTLNMTLKVNTGLPTFASLYFFTTSQDYDAMNIKSGELIVCKKQTEVSDNTNVVYIDRANSSFSLGIKSETSKAKDEYGNLLYVISGTSVKQSDVVGPINANIAVLGKIISSVLNNYLSVLGVLVFLAVVLTVVRCTVFREKKTEEAPPQESKKPKKDKREKKSKAANYEVDYHGENNGKSPFRGGFDLDEDLDFDN